MVKPTERVRVKNEDLSDELPSFDELEDATIKIKQEEDEAPDLCAAATATAAEEAPPVDEESLLLLNPSQASQRPFPPNCPVLCVTPTTIILGTVEAVFIDISSESRNFVYRIIDDKDSTTFATEVQLQWGRSCPVWASWSTACQPCVVEAIYQKTRQSEPLYTLLAKDGSLHHLIPKRCIRYRIEETPTSGGASTAVQQDDSTTPNSSTLPPTSGSLTIPSTLTHACGNLERTVASVEIHPDAHPTGDTTTMQQYDDGNSGFLPVSGNESQHSSTDSVSELTADEMPLTVDATPATSEKRLPIKRSRHEEETEYCKKQKVTLGERFQPARYVDQSESFASMEHYSRDGAYENSGTQVVPSKNLIPKNLEREDKVLTESFYVPLMEIFSLDDLKAFNHSYSPSVLDKTKCSIHLQSASHSHCAFFELTGTEQAIDAASNMLEELLVPATNYYNGPRLLYFLALWNGHRFKKGKIVHQVLRRDFSRRKWMYCNELPHDFLLYIGLVIGGKGKGKQRMQEQTRCSISLNVRDKVPHYVIYGDSVDDVNGCIDLLEYSMASAKKIKEAEHERGYKAYK